MKSKLILFAIIALLMGPQLYKNMQQQDQLRKQIDQASIGLEADVDQADEQSGYVRVEGVNQRFTEKRLQQLLNSYKDLKTYYSYTWQWQGRQQATASALGLDRQHHFANSYLVGFKPFETEHTWVPLYTLAMRKRYEYDHIQYAGLRDIWQNSRQAFYYTRGDCEDHAIILADWLIGLGHDARVVVGTYKGEGHAWVVLFKEGEAYLLEATSKQKRRNLKHYRLASLATEYQPLYQFNRNKFWFNHGSTYTTRYTGGNWQHNSTFYSSTIRTY